MTVRHRSKSDGVNPDFLSLQLLLPETIRRHISSSHIKLTRMWVSRRAVINRDTASSPGLSFYHPSFNSAIYLNTPDEILASLKFYKFHIFFSIYFQFISVFPFPMNLSLSLGIVWLSPLSWTSCQLTKYEPLIMTEKFLKCRGPALPKHKPLWNALLFYEQRRFPDCISIASR